MWNRYVTPLIPMFFLVSSVAFSANESPQTFTLDGTLLAADHVSPLLDATAKVRVQVLNPAKTCVLYDEEQTVDTSSSNGLFTIQVGSAVGSAKRKTLDSGNTMAKVYQNTSAITGASCTYTPSPGDTRYVRVIVTPTSSSPETLSPDMVLDAVPNAVVAQSLQGVEKSGFLQVNSSVLLTQPKLEQFMQTLTTVPGMGVTYDGTNFQSYDPKNGGLLTAGSVNDTQIGSVAWAKLTSVPANLTAIAGLSCVDGKIIKRVSGVWACADDDTSGGGGGSPTGSASGDLSGTYPGPTVAKLQGRGVSVTAPVDGQILRYNNGASQWEPYNFGIGDLKTNAGTPQFISASCTASETLIWSSVTNTFQCTSIAITAAQVSGLTESDPKVGANTTNYLSKWNGSALVASGVMELAGNVGIGTAAPGAPLHVEGIARFTAGSFGLALSNGSTIAATNHMSLSAGTSYLALASPSNYINYRSGAGHLFQDGNGSTEWMRISATGSVGIGTNNPSTKLDVNGTINATAMTINGVPVGTSTGMTSLNGSSQTTQTFAIPGASGNAPNWSTNTGTGVHTLNIPMANTASVSAGLISKTEYDTFNNKVGASYSLAGDVTGTPATTVVDRIKGKAVSAAPTLTGQVLRYDGTNITPNFISMFDLRSTVTGTQAFGGVGCLSNQTLTWTSATDNLACTNISLPASQLTGLAAAESDPKVGANTTNYLSKWNGSALVASGLVESSGNLGVGTASPDSKLHIAETQTNTAFAMPVSLNVSTTAAPSSTSDAIFQSAQFEVISNAPVTYNSGMRGVASNAKHYGTGQIWYAYGQSNLATNENTGTIMDAQGIQNQVLNVSSGTISGATGAFNNISNNAAGTMNEARGVSSHINNTGAGTIWTARGLYVNIARSSGTIDTAYGLYLDNIQATNKYGVYQADAAAKNSFAGDVGVGTTNPAAKLEVAGAIKLGSMTACGAAQEGSQRYNSTLKIMEFCDGTAWQSFGGSASVPTGAVMAFNLASCPSGWSALTAAAGRTIIAAGSNGTNTYTLNANGGADSITLTTGQLPPHYHSVDPPSTTTSSNGAHTHSVTASNIGSGSVYLTAGGMQTYSTGSLTTSSSGAHTHTLDIPAFDSGTTGSGNPVDIRSAYYVLLYCQKN